MVTAGGYPDGGSPSHPSGGVPKKPSDPGGSRGRSGARSSCRTTARRGRGPREQRAGLPANASDVKTQHPNSFSARDTLRVGGREYDYYRLGALGSRLRPGDAAVLAEDPAREPRPLRGRTFGHEGRRRGARVVAAGRSRRRKRSPTGRRACCCKTSPACRASSTSPRCATRSPSSAAIRNGSTRCSRSSS